VESLCCRNASRSSWSTPFACKLPRRLRALLGRAARPDERTGRV